MAKTLYHSELVQMCELGPLEVTVKSDILKSKYSKPNAPKPDYVVLIIEGEERNYSFDTDACRTPFDGQKGQTFSIVAEGSGKDGSAAVTYVGASGAALQRPPPPQRQAARPPAWQPGRQAAPPQRQQQSQPAQQQAQPPRREPLPTNGARVGAAVNKAVDIVIASGQAWDPKVCWEIASDIMRISERLELSKLALPYSERPKTQQ